MITPLPAAASPEEITSENSDITETSVEGFPTVAHEDITEDDVLATGELRVGDDQQSLEIEVEGDASVEVTDEGAEVYGPEDEIIQTLPAQVEGENGESIVLAYEAVSD